MKDNRETALTANRRRPLRSNGKRAILIALALAAAAFTGCGNPGPEAQDPIDLADIHFDVTAETQQGSIFEIAVPAVDGIEIVAVEAPPGIEASLTTGDPVAVRIEVSPELEPGGYQLGLQVRTDQTMSMVNWPFTVTAGPADSAK